MPHVRVNDCDLHYEEAGEGSPVVFVHGLWCSGRFFGDRPAALAARSRCLVLDLRGHGRSERTAAGHTVAQHARDLKAFCEALGLEDVVVVGWSMGSLIAWDYVEQFGAANLRAIVTVDQSPLDLKTADWEWGLLDVEGLRALNRTVQTDFAGLAPQFVQLLHRDPVPADELEALAAEVASVPPAIASSILFDQTVSDYRRLVPALGVPSLLCFGRSGNVVPVEAGEWMHTRMPGSELVIFEESDHCPFREEPQRFEQVVGDWIAALG